jgi:hypothetical protein
VSWINKQDPRIFCLQETYLTDKTKYWLRVKDWKKYFLSECTQKKAERTTLISDKVDMKVKLVRRGKEGYYILMKE